MAVIIDLPKERLNKIKLADWLEINALLDKDNSSSIEDLSSRLKVEYADRETTIENLKTDVSSELLSRSRKLNKAYPFRFNGKLVEAKSKKPNRNQWAYLFCLFVSYIGLEKGAKELNVWEKQKTSDLFEKLSSLVAENFLSSKKVDAQSLQFGAPRNSWVQEKKPFRRALEFLKTKISEGDIKNNSNASRKKDAGLDIVAWRSFPDGRKSKLFLLGQCAAGNDFKNKKWEIKELQQYYSFWDMPGIIFSFFIPHEIDESDWQDFYYPDIGILFDRSRIAFWAQEWDGGWFKAKLPTIYNRLRKYGKAL